MALWEGSQVIEVYGSRNRITAYLAFLHRAAQRCIGLQQKTFGEIALW